MRDEVRDLPRDPVCHFRHDPPECENADFPPGVAFLGTTLNGRDLWVVGDVKVTPGPVRSGKRAMTGRGSRP